MSLRGCVELFVRLLLRVPPGLREFPEGGVKRREAGVGRADLAEVAHRCVERIQQVLAGRERHDVVAGRSQHMQGDAAVLPGGDCSCPEERPRLAGDTRERPVGTDLPVLANGLLVHAGLDLIERGRTVHSLHHVPEHPVGGVVGEQAAQRPA